MVELQNFALFFRISQGVTQVDSFRRGRFISSPGSISVRILFHPNHMSAVPTRFLLKSYDLLHSVSGSYPKFSYFFYRRKIKKSYYTLKSTAQGFRLLLVLDTLVYFIYPFLAATLVGEDFSRLQSQDMFSFTEPGFVSKNLSLSFSSFAEFEKYVLYYFSAPSARSNSFSLLFPRGVVKSVRPRQLQISE